MKNIMTGKLNSMIRKSKSFILLFLCLGALLIILGVTASPTKAANLTFVVDSSLDSVDKTPGDGICADEYGLCTLRAAIQEASESINFGSDTIEVPAGTYILSIEGVGEDSNLTGDLDIFDDVIIIGAGADQTFIQAGPKLDTGIDRVFHVASSTTFDISGVTIRYGSATTAGSENGGGIFNDGGTVVVSDSAIVSNTASNSGGAIYNLNGVFDLNRSLVAYNNAALVSAILSEALLDEAEMRIASSTISSNKADTGGVTISDKADSIESSFINISMSTIASNVEAAGVDPSTNGFITLEDTILTDNPGPECIQPVSTFGIFVDDTSCEFSTPSAVPVTGFDQVLADNGGPTLTHALFESSNAIGAGSSFGCNDNTLDQRGYPRPIQCDVGAYEFQSAYNISIENSAVITGSNIFQDGQDFYAYDNNAVLGVSRIEEALKDGDVRIFTNTGAGGQEEMFRLDQS